MIRMCIAEVENVMLLQKKSLTTIMLLIFNNFLEFCPRHEVGWGCPATILMSISTKKGIREERR